ncbi:MAG: transposase [Candidatus Aminicenantales bacterium]
MRIEYPGAFYHVYSRGNQKQPIFFSDEDRYYFLKILRDANERLGVVVHIYCLMNTHYHLTLETPEANLSQIMHFINSSYSIYLNKKHERCGHLFQGRFKAILIQADAYARTLAEYIHGNPVRKNIVDRPEEYPWSSCQDYYGIRNPPPWLDTSVILRAFGNSLEVLKLEHERYLGTADEKRLEKDMRNASRLGILGDDDFIDKIRRSYLKDRMENPDRELCELRRLRVRPEISDIQAEIDRELGAANRLAKKCVIFLARKRAGYKLREIGDHLGLSPGAVSLSYRKTSMAIGSNETLRRVVETVWVRLSDAGKDPVERRKVKKV